jgi:hypothetical protein
VLHGPRDRLRYTVTLTVTGDQHLHGTMQMSEQYSCRQFLAKKAAGGTEVPLPQIALNNFKDSFEASLEGWKGPGTYKLQSPHNNTSFISVGNLGGVTVGRQNYSTPVQGETKPANVTAVVTANGAISITFSNLALNGQPSRTVSGHAQYSCKNI